MLLKIRTQIREYFEERGVTTADFPKAFIAHEFLSVAFLAFTWAACYQIQPSKSPMLAPINETLRSSNSFLVVKMRQSYETVISKAEQRLGQEWFMKRGIDRGRVAVSLAESTVLRKLVKPISIPSKLWLTWKFVEAVNLAETDKSIEDAGRHPSGKPKRNRSNRATRGSTAAREDTEGSLPSSSRRRFFWGGKLWGREVARKPAACSPFGGGGAGCFVVSPRTGRVTRQSGKSVSWRRPKEF